MTNEKKEISRAIVLYVDEVLTVVPDITESFGPVLRNVRLEMTKHQAKKLRDQLDEQIQRNLPGSVTVQLKGHLTI